MRARSWWLLIGLLCWAGCESSSGSEGPSGRLGAMPPTAAGAAGAAAAEDECAKAALAQPPTSIVEIVDHLNTLPKPVGLPCLLRSLPRPLALHATRSTLSAQPSVGLRSPRIFVLYERLTMSIALDGMGKNLLEFGEHRPQARSLKAEIEFPVAEELSHGAPFQRVLYKDTQQTGCAFCHAAESRDESIDFAPGYDSVALRPVDRQETISVAALATLRAECDSEAEPLRCAMLDSLFARGMPVDQAFPADYATLN